MHIVCCLFPVRRNLLHLLIELYRQVGTQSALNTVQVYLGAKFQTPHVPYMGEIMLHTGSRAGHPGIGHGHTADNQAFKDRFHRLFFPAQQTLGVVHALLKGRPDQLGHFFAVVFPGNEICDPPLGNTDELCQHITKTSLQHVIGGGLQNIRIADDHIRAAAI